MDRRVVHGPWLRGGLFSRVITFTSMSGLRKRSNDIVVIRCSVSKPRNMGKLNTSLCVMPIMLKILTPADRKQIEARSR